MKHDITPKTQPDCTCHWCQAHWHLECALVDAETDNIDLYSAKEVINRLHAEIAALKAVGVTVPQMPSEKEWASEEARRISESDFILGSAEVRIAHIQKALLAAANRAYEKGHTAGRAYVRAGAIGGPPNPYPKED